MSELNIFHSEHYWILLLDQRGAGQSLPVGELEHNHLNGLICDIEVIRIRLGIARWCLAGGSFGATLALVYSGLFPHRVIAQLLWGPFIPSQAGLDWLYGSLGAARLYPRAYCEFVGTLGAAPSALEVLQLYRKGLHSQDAETQALFARRWLKWELNLVGVPCGLPRRLPPRLFALAQIEQHYAMHNYFNMFSVLQRAIPRITSRTLLLQGGNDAVCPSHLLNTFIETFAVHRFELTILADAGHSLQCDRLSLGVSLAFERLYHEIN